MGGTEQTDRGPGRRGNGVGAVHRRGAAAVVVAAALVAVLALGGASPTPARAAGSYDAYGGWTGTTLAATGAFRTAEVAGRWWLVTPDGHPFFSNGLNHVTPIGTVDKNGHAAYHEAILAKYGSESAWAAAQVARFGTWGINTLGGWSDIGLFDGRGVPYTVTLSLAGQNSGTGRMADFWSPGWVSSVQSSTASAAAGRTNDPWLVGYFLDNELHWTKDWRSTEQLDFYLQRDAAEPGKVHLVDWLRSRYANDFAAFAADFTTDATDWASLLAATTIADAGGAGARPTRDAWVGEIAERYFSVAHAALKAADPNHLDLGTRLVAQVITPEVLQAAAAHVDVVSINWYEILDQFEEYVANLGPDFLPTADTLAAHGKLSSKPLMITEFGWRAMDSGLPNTWPPLQVVVDTQQERATRYRNFGQCLVNTGYVVGAYWFEMTDEPAIGRFDGENDNWGMVTEADEEYPLVTAAAAAVHDMAYAPLTDPAWTPGACRPQGPQLATTTTTTAAPTTTTAAPSTTSAASGPATAGTGRGTSPTVTPAFTG